MSLKGKLVEKIGIKCDGDGFFKMFGYSPRDLSSVSSNNIQGCDIQQGEFITVGSIVYFKYTDDGKQREAKEVIEAIDQANKSVTYKVIEGDLMEVYKYFTITVSVDTNGKKNYVTWTFDFEKFNVNSPHPVTLMKAAVDVTKDIEANEVGF